MEIFSMDFTLSKEQKDIQMAAREFAQGEFDPDAALGLEKEGHYPFEIWKKASDLGFIGMHIPEEYGGQNLGILDNALVAEEFCRQNSGIGMALSLSGFGSEMILRFGSDDQRGKYLPSIAKGENASSLAYIEEGQRKGFESFTTTATKKNHGYLINGNKSFVVNGTLPGFLIVLCQLADTTRPAGQVALILHKDTDGLVAIEIGGRIGMRMLQIANLSFHDLEVSYENLIGEEGQGQSQLMNFLHEMNIEAAAMATGIAQGAFDLGLAYAKQREQFGRKIGSFEAIRDRLADMDTRIEIARLLTYGAAWHFDNNDPNPKINYMAKMVSADTALEVARDSLHIFGGYGYVVENRIEQFYRDASMVDIVGIPGGTDKSLIADQIIGKI
jgi:alkylation response protein AidB-like acyl-CoA dehydrogenase